MDFHKRLLPADAPEPFLIPKRESLLLSDETESQTPNPRRWTSGCPYLSAITFGSYFGGVETGRSPLPSGSGGGSKVSISDLIGIVRSRFCAASQDHVLFLPLLTSLNSMWGV